MSAAARYQTPIRARMTVARGSADFIGVPCPHPALRATFSLREKGRGAPFSLREKVDARSAAG